MTGLLSDKEIAELMPAELCPHRTPIPTQTVASDEYYPAPQNARQREVEARLLAMADELGGKSGLDRRRFFQTASGMAAAFVAMNEVYGEVFNASRAEAAVPEQAQARAESLKDQFIMDMHTHFLRDDTRLTGFVAMREAVGRAGWNKELVGKEQTIEDLKFGNYKKEMFLDSDTKIALISSAPSDIKQDWFLTNQMMADAREKVNRQAGSRRLFAHAIFTPGQPGWLDDLDAALALKPESCKGYTVGDNTHKEISHYPWRMDDEKVTYKGYEKILKAGIRNVCVHKGLFPPSTESRFPNLVHYADVRDVGQAANGLAAAQLYHLPLGLPPCRRRSGGGTGGVRTDRAHLLDQRSCRHSAQIWRAQCLWRCRPTLRHDAGGAAASLRRANGHPDPRPRRGSGDLGDRRAVDGLASVANRGSAAHGNPGGHAEEIRLRTAR